MLTIIDRLFRYLGSIFISIMSIFNVLLIYLIGENDEDDTNEHEYSETVAEIRLNPMVFDHGPQIDDIIYTNDQNYIRFGQSQPCHPVELLFYKVQKLINRICFHIFFIILGVGMCYIIYTSTIASVSFKGLQIDDKLMLISSNDTYHDLVVKEENVSFDINAILYNKFDVDIDDEIKNPANENRSNIKDLLQVNYAITIVNNLTCKLYNAFLYGFTSTFCWKDDIKDFTGAELSDDMHSFDDSYEKNTMNILNTSVNGSEKADVLCDQILQDEENPADEDQVDYKEMTLSTYSMSMHSQN
ncbi:unnamed protein product [Rotaria magnacalcarata]